MVWCFADYDSALWNRPPLDRALHERFFGLIRPDGSIKPHAALLKQFAATSPTVTEPAVQDIVSVDGSDYYRSPRDNLERLYEGWLSTR
jgi:hypothetical protein